MFINQVINGIVENTLIVGDVIVALAGAVWPKVKVVPFRLPFVLPDMSPRTNFLNADIGVSDKPVDVLLSHLQCLFCGKRTKELRCNLNESESGTRLLSTSWSVTHRLTNCDGEQHRNAIGHAQPIICPRADKGWAVK